jgi:molecular chaperone HtpG
MDKCKDLIPDYLRFVKGLVDSSDLSLNISREMLQQNAILKKISSNIETKIIKELNSIKENDKDKYNTFWKNYGSFIKYGLYEGFGSRNDTLKDLLIYHHSNGDDMISLKDYVSLMKEGQAKIYYVSSSSKNNISKMPQMELLKKKGYDILLLDDDIDEFCIQVLSKYEEKEFANVSSENLDLLDEEEKKDIEKVQEENKDIIASIKESLNGQVKDVVISKRLVDSPVCLVSGEGLSFEMEKVLSSNKLNNGVKADRILEINPNHPLFESLKNVYAKDKDALKDYSYLLLEQAMLIEGMPLDNPVEFSNKMCELMIKSSK